MVATVCVEEYELGAVATSGDPRMNTFARIDTPEADELPPARFVPTRCWSVERKRQIAPLFLEEHLRGSLSRSEPGIRRGEYAVSGAGSVDQRSSRSAEAAVAGHGEEQP